MDSTLVQPQRTGSGLGSPAAWSTIAGALLQLVLGLALAPHQHPGSPYFGIITALNLTSHLLLFGGMIGLLRSGAVGTGRLGPVGLVLTLLGLAGLVIAEPLSLANMNLATIGFSVATLALMVGLILAGIAMLRAGRWAGWQRLTLLACGLYVPLVLLPAFALPGYAANYAIGIWGGCWLLLGIAMGEAGTLSGRTIANSG